MHFKKGDAVKTRHALYEQDCTNLNKHKIKNDRDGR